MQASSPPTRPRQYYIIMGTPFPAKMSSAVETHRDGDQLNRRLRSGGHIPKSPPPPPPTSQSYGRHSFRIRDSFILRSFPGYTGQRLQSTRRSIERITHKGGDFFDSPTGWRCPSSCVSPKAYQWRRGKKQQQKFAGNARKKPQQTKNSGGERTTHVNGDYHVLREGRRETFDKCASPRPPPRHTTGTTTTVINSNTHTYKPQTPPLPTTIALDLALNSAACSHWLPAERLLSKNTHKKPLNWETEWKAGLL